MTPSVLLFLQMWFLNTACVYDGLLTGRHVFGASSWLLIIIVGVVGYQIAYSSKGLRHPRFSGMVEKSSAPVRTEDSP